MISIGLLSDTHGFFDEKLLEFFNQCDEVWHAGDLGSGVDQQISSFKLLRAVAGNIDDKYTRNLFPGELKFQCEELKVYITHIGGAPGHYEMQASKAIESFAPDIFICGHSHILKIEKDLGAGFYYINPGAAGRVGLHQVRTIVRFKIDRKRLFDLEVIELGKRGS